MREEARPKASPLPASLISKLKRLVQVEGEGRAASILTVSTGTLARALGGLSVYGSTAYTMKAHVEEWERRRQ